MSVPLPKKGMKLTKLSPAPGKLEAPSSALQRFALCAPLRSLSAVFGEPIGTT